MTFANLNDTEFSNKTHRELGNILTLHTTNVTGSGLVNESNPLSVKILDTFGHNTPAAVDPVTASLAIIEVSHGEIHAGRMFYITNETTSNNLVNYQADWYEVNNFGN